jgi:hypothetical protein
MMTLIIAAAAAAAQPTAPAETGTMNHEQHMQMRHDGEHKGMDCCKDCCKDMAAKHDGHGSDHAEHSSQ